jgi:hypothetical protein
MPCQAADRAMTEDKTKTDPEDAKPISLTKAYEITYGRKKFGEGNQRRQAEAARRFGDWPRPSSSSSSSGW